MLVGLCGSRRKGSPMLDLRLLYAQVLAHIRRDVLCFSQPRNSSGPVKACSHGSRSSDTTRSRRRYGSRKPPRCGRVLLVGMIREVLVFSVEFVGSFRLSEDCMRQEAEIRGSEHEERRP